MMDLLLDEVTVNNIILFRIMFGNRYMFSYKIQPLESFKIV